MATAFKHEVPETGSPLADAAGKLALVASAGMAAMAAPTFALNPHDAGLLAADLEAGIRSFNDRAIRLGGMEHSEADMAALIDEGYAICDQIEALPNTPKYLRLRALAIGAAVDNTDDLANLDLNELSAHAHGNAGRLVRQVLAVVTAAPLPRTPSPQESSASPDLSMKIKARQHSLAAYNDYVRTEHGPMEEALYARIRDVHQQTDASSDIARDLREDEIRAREGELLTADCDAIRAVLDHRPSGIAELLAKFRFIRDTEVWDMEETKDSLLADLAHLDGEMAA